MNQVATLPNELTQQSLDSLFFTSTALLGYDKLTSHLHYEMCQVAQLADKYKRLLVLVPRDHYKSTIFTISYPIWRSFRNPNETGLIVANTATNAERFVGQIRKHWEDKPLLRRLHWHLRPELSDRWNKQEACLPRTVSYPEATWSAAGWDTKVTSQHFDYIIFDDIVDEETYRNPELMQKLIERFEQREGLLRPPIHDRTIIIVMNHWSTIDIACHVLEKHPEYKVYYRQAIENGRPIFPEMYTLDWLLRKQKQDPYTFAIQFMNNPIDPGVTEIQPEMLREYKRKPDGLELPSGEFVSLGQLNIYGAVDPRHSLSITPAEKMTSRNAITIAGIDPKGRRYLLDEWTSRSGPSDLVNKMLELHKLWNPIKFTIESFGYQAALKPLAEQIWRNEPDKPRLDLTKRDTTRSKDNRCRGGLEFFRKELAYLHRTHVYFKEEALTFPHGKTKDVLDAWAWCMETMYAPSSENDYAGEREADREYFKSLNPMVGI